MLSYALKSSLQTIKATPFYSLMTSLVIGIMLMLPIAFWLSIKNIASATSHLMSVEVISVYLKNEISSQDEKEVFEKIKSFPGVSSAIFKSKTEAMLDIEGQTDIKSLMASLPENPLPSLIQVTPTKAYLRNDLMTKLTKKLNELPEVDEVSADGPWLTSIHTTLYQTEMIAYVILFFLSLAVLFVIYTILRLLIRNQSAKIEVLDLIGASPKFIAKPFLYTGMFYGFSGAMFALLFVYLFSYLFQYSMRLIPLVSTLDLNIMGLSWINYLFFLIIGPIVGWGGAYLSLKRQLAC